MKRDPYKYFRIEARELLQQISRDVLELEKNGRSEELVSRLLRSAHTLKGAARVVKQLEIGARAHAMEDALAPLRSEAESVSEEAVDSVLETLDAIAAMVDALDAAPPGPPDVPDAPRAPAATSSTLAQEGSQQALMADVEDVEAIGRDLSTAWTRIGEMRGALQSLDRAARAADRLLIHIDGPGLSSPESERSAEHAALRDCAEELRSSLSAAERSLVGSLEHLTREIGELRETAERLRLVSAGGVLRALERVARDEARTLGRQIDVEVRGGDVRLDGNVVANVQRALVQLVRNAIAHGVEPEVERVAAGKPPRGTLVLEVARRGNRIAFACGDDGRGIDFAAVERIAREKGLLTSSVAGRAAEALIELLLRGGISTSDSVSEIAGRAVGLDVVRDVASRLGGRVSVRTKTGEGTTFELLVPVSLSTLEVLVVQDSRLELAIPLTAVRRVVRVGLDDVMRTPEGDVVVVDGQALPFAPLRSVLSEGPASSGATSTWSAVVLESEGVRAAVGVERLRGATHVVVRPVPTFAPSGPLVGGLMLDDAGDPRIVLDPRSCVDAVQSYGSRPIARSDVLRKLPILVVDDSLTTRMLEQSILESAGFEVDLAISAEEALVKAQARRYGLFLVDVEMPGMDGFSFVERTREDETLREVPAILVTSRSSVEDRQRGVDAGAVDYVVKSEFDQDRLLATIREVMR